MASALRTILPVLAGIALTAAGQPAALTAAPPTHGAPGRERLTPRDLHDLRCAAAVAMVATRQANGDAAALALPPLGIRGQRYFALTGERIAAATALSATVLRDVLTEAAQGLAHEGATAVAQACLADVDAVVPPRPAPDALVCHAMLGVYAEVLTARDAGSALAATLARESLALAPAARALLAARRIDPAGQAATIDQARAAVRLALNGGDGGSAPIDADGFGQCRHLAQTPPKTG
ncbi:hypothetical protein [Novosphingobium sp.]|uniref:hypothetical protein n=1 Tax=Novosphingobium sp. TaxID=1874826 RepID=UPI003340042A